MPIIINEFEIIAPQADPSGGRIASQQGSRNSDTGAEQNGRSEPLRPEDVERILRHCYLRRARLWAD